MFETVINVLVKPAWWCTMVVLKLVVVVTPMYQVERVLEEVEAALGGSGADFREVGGGEE